MQGEGNGPRTTQAGTVLDWLGFTPSPDWAKARWLGAGLGVLVLCLFGLALIALFGVLGQTIAQSFSGESAGPNLGAGALIAALLGAPFVIWGTVLKHRTVTFQKEGHLTDRINKAVEMLGAEKTVKRRGEDADGKPVTVEETVPNIEVRIGAILSLERIAQDSTAYDKGRDHVRVMEILCAYVRENSHARKPVDYPEPEWEPLKDGASEEERAAHQAKREERFGQMYLQGKAWKWAQALPAPRADIATALTVLGRRTHAQRKAEAAWPHTATEATIWPFDLPCPVAPEVSGDLAQDVAAVRTFMWSIWMWKEPLREYSGYRIDLRGATLQGADLSRAVLSGAILSGARLDGADLSLSLLRGAELDEAHFVGTNLNNAKLETATLKQARLEGANLYAARLTAAQFWSAQMEGASLCHAEATCADFSYAKLAAADLFDTRLDGADFYGALLDGANLEGATLVDAMLWNGTPRVIPLSADQGRTFLGDASILLPDGVTRPAHWPNWICSRVFYDEEEREKWRADPAGYRPVKTAEQD
jgi:uncharacterized protein YjbI with pentapeptide repeats